MFAEIDAAAPADCIFASSTSAIPGSHFLEPYPTPERALVAHPVNPPALIPLVELCATPIDRRGDAGADQRDHGRRRHGAGRRRARRSTDSSSTGCSSRWSPRPCIWSARAIAAPSDIDTVITQGLALRWASIGPFEVMHLNAARGFKGFAENLGGMMRRLGADARTDYDWTEALIDRIHAELVERVPLAEIPQRQTWRDQRIIATRRMQKDG